MTPRLLADATADLLASPRPVLFLDTCDVVNLLQVGTSVPVGELRAVVRLLAALAANPQRCQPVVSYVTVAEYAQKTDPTDVVYLQDSATMKLPPDAMTASLAELDALIDNLHQIRQVLGQALAPPAIIYSNLNLVADLKAVADQLLDLCWALQPEQACQDAAIDRVFAKTRPSHKREVKDSFHLEHCLELGTRLRANGFAPAIVFVSANKKDYGPATGTLPHFDLQPSFAAVQMSYFENMSRAIHHLGI